MISEVLNELKNKDYISNIENINVEKLFNKVNEYIKTNYICEENEKYYVVYDNNNYELGMIYGPEDIYYYIKKCNHLGNIDLLDAINNNLSKEKEIIKEKINYINDLINSLHQEEGLSLSLIRKSIKMKMY